MIRRVAAATYNQKPITNNREGSPPPVISYKSSVRSPFIGTFHALGARILRGEGRAFGRNPNFVIFDDSDRLSLVRKIVKAVGAKTEQGPSFYLRKISELKNGAGSVEDLQSSGGGDDGTSLRIYNEYEQALREHNAFDLDDLIEKVVRLLGERREVLKRCQSLFRYVFVDEYQDLNPKQYEFIRLLAGAHRNLSVVGDDHQMIYGWRYANIETFLNFERDWPDAQIVVLEENYRSTGNIIRAASSVIENNKGQKSKRLWTKNAPGQAIRVLEVEDEEKEAEWIAATIAATNDKRLTTNDKNNSLKVVGHKSSVVSQSTAVLYRTNAQSRALEQALINLEIPYEIFGGIKFYERREIKDAVAALRLAMNPKDALSRDRLQKNLTKGTLRKFEEALGSLGAGAPLRLVEAFLAATDYLARIEKEFRNAEERKENLRELIRFASKFESLGVFLEQISLLQRTDAGSKGERAILDPQDAQPKHSGPPVRLTTIHLSKGLEFERVFLAGCSEGLLPHGRALGDENELEEERRLMYVAMTRAKRELVITFSGFPSRFLGELPGDGIAVQSLVSELNPLREDEERYITLE